jgi:hypothetical protein
VDSSDEEDGVVEAFVEILYPFQNLIYVPRMPSHHLAVFGPKVRILIGWEGKGA